MNAPESWIAAVKFIPNTDNFKIVYKKNIKLNDGTKAVKAKISWTMQDFPLNTSFISFEKDNKKVVINSTGPANISFKVMEKIIDSLKLN